MMKTQNLQKTLTLVMILFMKVFHIMLMVYMCIILITQMKSILLV